MINRFSLWLQEAWFRGAAWLVLLRPVEWFYRVVIYLRKKLYALRVLPRYRASCPVVIVGNITVGGSGKTPTVIALVEALAERGIRAGVVSRGYGASRGMKLHRVNAQSRVEHCGDEMLMVYRRTGVPCAVAPRRSQAVALLAEGGEVDVVLSDDGLQHYALARDFEIVLYDAESAFGNGRCLPAGPLREPLSRLREADVVLARTGGSGCGESGSAQSAPDQVLLVARSLVNLVTGEERSPAEHGLPQSVLAIAGVGRPALFVQMLSRLGFRPSVQQFVDHHRYSRADFDALQADHMAGHSTAHAEPVIIMTEKDAVKCAAFATQNTWYLKVDALLPEALVDRVVDLVSTRQHERSRELL